MASLDSDEELPLPENGTAVAEEAAPINAESFYSFIDTLCTDIHAIECKTDSCVYVVYVKDYELFLLTPGEYAAGMSAFQNTTIRFIRDRFIGAKCSELAVSANHLSVFLFDRVMRSTLNTLSIEAAVKKFPTTAWFVAIVSLSQVKTLHVSSNFPLSADDQETLLTMFLKHSIVLRIPYDIKYTDQARSRSHLSRQPYGASSKNYRKPLTGLEATADHSSLNGNDALRLYDRVPNALDFVPTAQVHFDEELE